MKRPLTCKREKSSSSPVSVIQFPEMEILENCKGWNLFRDRYKKVDRLVVVLKWTQLIMKDFGGQIHVLLVI